MNAKPTRTLFAAVAVSALAAVLASSAQARIPEGNGTRPPSRAVVDEQQIVTTTALANAELYAAMTSPVVEQRLARHRSQTFSVGSGFYAAMTSSVVEQRLARHRSGTFPAGYRGRP